MNILGFKGNWYVKSNRESGNGYTDLMIEVENEKIGIVIEMKYAENARFEETCAKAMSQIEDTNYIAVLKEDRMRTIWKYGIACYKKECVVVLEKEEESHLL